MTKTTLLAALALITAAEVAHAGGQAGTIGVGVEYGLASLPLTGGSSLAIGGPSINYDTGKFHAGGFFALYDGGGTNDTTFGIGGRFYYHLHATAMSDFSIGGTLGMLSIDTGPDRATLMSVEPGAQIRMFVAANVALSFSVGLAIGAFDADGFALTGQANASAGVHYYFF